MIEMQTVALTTGFESDARVLLGDDGLDALVSFLAAYPMAGQLIPDTGGLRKLRWGTGTRGKRGGARAIYYVHDADAPIYCLAIYGKGEQVDLSPAQRARYAAAVARLKDGLKRRRTG